MKRKKRELNECDKIREVGPHKKVGKAKKKNSKKMRKKGLWKRWFGMCFSDHHIWYQHHTSFCFFPQTHLIIEVQLIFPPKTYLLLFIHGIFFCLQITLSLSLINSQRVLFSSMLGKEGQLYSFHYFSSTSTTFV